MYRGTTPNITIKINSDLDLSTMTQIWVTFKNASAEITYDIDDIELNVAEKTIALAMSQEDTLSFKSDINQANKVEVQVRFLDDNGMAYASNISTVTLFRILKEGVIKND